MNLRMHFAALLAFFAALAGAPAAAGQDALHHPLVEGALSSGGGESLAAERLFGRSGALRVALLGGSNPPDPLLALTAPWPDARYRWRALFDTRTTLLGEPSYTSLLTAPETPGVWQLELDRPDFSTPLAIITKVPFAWKTRGMLNGYHIGTYPTEFSGRTDGYAPPSGFIEVTAENQHLQISEHFRLGQFLTKDQFTVWPKYLALSLDLVDKLELVMQELKRMGIRADRMHVMSGFRTPQYNGPGEGGRAALSRHMWGDAADVWVDSDGDGHMDDLNGDGLIDHRDAEVIMLAVERVEAKHPDLVGGAGVYTWNGPRGPFIHIDVRGTRSRW
jgi:hypothetical protein